MMQDGEQLLIRGWNKKVGGNNITFLSELWAGRFSRAILNLYEEAEFVVYDSNVRHFIRKLKLWSQ